MAQSVTFEKKRTQSGVRFLIIEWACDAGASADFDWAFTSAAMSHIRGRNCSMAVTIPGGHAKCAGTAPTALYDIEILDEYDVDIFGGQLKDRSATLSEQTTPLVDTSLMSRLIAGDLTFTLTNNAVNGANGKLILYFEV